MADGDKRKGRRPDFEFVASEIDGEGFGTIGVGWYTKNNGISVRLNPGARIDWSDPVWLMLHPRGDRQ